MNIDFKEELEKAFAVSPFIALASMDGEKPAVRVVDALYDAENSRLLFIANARSAKNAQFAANEKVAFTTTPAGPGATVRSNDAVVRKSDVAVDSIKDQIIARRETFGRMLEAFGDQAVVYEVAFDTAKVFLHGQEAEVQL